MNKLRKPIKAGFLFILFLIISNLHAQLTHTFTQIAHNTEYGSPGDIAIGADGTVFMTSGFGGLRAYHYDGDMLYLRAHIDNGGDAKGLTIAEDGTVFLANGYDGLRSYTFDGHSFSNIAHEPIDSGEALDVTLGADGTIYLASGREGLRVYSYDGNSFTYKAHAPIDSGIASGVEVGPDGTIFLANAGYSCISTCAGEPDDGLRAYIYDGHSLVNTAHVNDEGLASGVLVIDPDGMIFLGSNAIWSFDPEFSGIRIYTYRDTAFTNVINIDAYASAMVVTLNKTLFVANDSLWAYAYDDTSFQRITRIELDGTAKGMAIGQDGEIFLTLDNGISVFRYVDSTFAKTAHLTAESGAAAAVAIDNHGTIFLANGDDGIRAYRYQGTSTLDNVAHINNGEGFGASAVDIALGSEGDVFAAYHINGLRAYRFMADSLIGTAHVDDGRNTDYARGVAVGPDGTVFLANGGDGLRAYGYNGSVFRNLGDINNPYSLHPHSGVITAEDVAVDSSGTVFLAFLSAGLWAYRFDGSSFTTTAHIDEEINGARGVAVGPDGTVFLANSGDGLRAYHYDGSSFTNTAHIQNEGTAFGVAVGPDGTVYLANDYDGLRAYSYDGKSFINIAHIDEGGEARKVAAGADGIVFLANTFKGLAAYKYSGDATAIKNTQSEMPKKYSLNQNYPNPFNPKTNIQFSILESAFIALKIYNILGEEVATLVTEKLPAGNYKYDWDASNQASGIYFYRIQAGGFVETKAMILMK